MKEGTRPYPEPFQCSAGPENAILKVKKGKAIPVIGLGGP
jgi:hypothetical protein